MKGGVIGTLVEGPFQGKKGCFRLVDPHFDMTESKQWVSVEDKRPGCKEAALCLSRCCSLKKSSSAENLILPPSACFHCIGVPP